MKPLKIIYTNLPDLAIQIGTDQQVVKDRKQIDTEATLEAIIDRVNEISAIVEPKIIATTVTSYDEFGLKGDIKKVGTTPIKRFKDMLMWKLKSDLDGDLGCWVLEFPNLEQAEEARNYLLNL